MDVVENIAVQYRINDVEAKLPDISTIAYEHDWFRSESLMREVMIGLGFQEIMSLMLTNEDAHFSKMKQNPEQQMGNRMGRKRFSKRNI